VIAAAPTEVRVKLDHKGIAPPGAVEKQVEAAPTEGDMHQRGALREIFLEEDLHLHGVGEHLVGVRPDRLCIGDLCVRQLEAGLRQVRPNCVDVLTQLHNLSIEKEGDLGDVVE